MNEVCNNVWHHVRVIFSLHGSIFLLVGLTLLKLVQIFFKLARDNYPRLKTSKSHELLLTHNHIQSLKNSKMLSFNPKKTQKRTILLFLTIKTNHLQQSLLQKKKIVIFLFPYSFTTDCIGYYPQWRKKLRNIYKALF